MSFDTKALEQQMLSSVASDFFGDTNNGIEESLKDLITVRILPLLTAAIVEQEKALKQLPANSEGRHLIQLNIKILSKRKQAVLRRMDRQIY